MKSWTSDLNPVVLIKSAGFIWIGLDRFCHSNTTCRQDIYLGEMSFRRRSRHVGDNAVIGGAENLLKSNSLSK